MTGHYAIAIDGPAASGKSTLARNLAKHLGLIMVNSGAMYRAITWKALQEKIDPTDTVAIGEMLGRISIECGNDGIQSTISIDATGLSDELRSEEVNAKVSRIAAIPEVRDLLLKLQRDYLQHSSVVMEGRDIGSVVFPETPYKIYVDAAEHVRAARRKSAGEIDSVAQRDQADSGRKNAPLKVATGATILDTTGLTIETTLHAALEILQKQGLVLETSGGTL